MSSHEIEDVLASIRRLVSDDLRPANRPHPIGKLMLTPALRVVPASGLVDTGDAPLDHAPEPAPSAPVTVLRDDWVPDQSSLAAVGDRDAEHLDFTSSLAAAATARVPSARTALQSAAEAFHAQADEFILSYSDSGAFVLRGDVPSSAPEPRAPNDHGAVFAMLNTADAAGRIPPVEVLVDAEGGAPVEDEAEWATVDWEGQDAGASESRAGMPGQAKSEIVQDGPAGDGPLILPFVSQRRSSEGLGAEVLTLRRPVVQVMGTGAEMAEHDMLAEPLILQSGSVVQDASGPDVSGDPDRSGDADGRDATAAATTEAVAELAVNDAPASDAAEMAPENTSSEPVLAVPPHVDSAPEIVPVAEPGIGKDEADTPRPQDDIATAVMDAHQGDKAESSVGLPSGSGAQATDDLAGKDLPEGVGAAEASTATLPEDVAAASAIADPAQDMSEAAANLFQEVADESAMATAPLAELVLTERVLPETAPAAEIAAMQDPAIPGEVPVVDTLGATLTAATTRSKVPARLAEAAFTRWPGWAQSDPDDADSAGPPLVAPKLAKAAEAPRKKPKAAVQDPGWADRAEAEIHRQLAAELGMTPLRDVAPPAQGLQMSEAALRDLVRDMIREELTGKLGERITQNVRKLVQLELQKTMSLHVAEFRSQRRDMG